MTLDWYSQPSAATWWWDHFVNAWGVIGPSAAAQWHGVYLVRETDQAARPTGRAIVTTLKADEILILEQALGLTPIASPYERLRRLTAFRRELPINREWTWVPRGWTEITL